MKLKPTKKTRTAILSILSATIASTAILTPQTSFAQEHWMQKIGHRWDVKEDDGWKGVWSRRTYPTVNSNIYDATWTNPNYPTITAELRITLSVRNEITVIRKDISGGPAGNRCTYRGRLSSNGYNASGTVTCSYNPSRTASWSAVIRR